MRGPPRVARCGAIASNRPDRKAFGLRVEYDKTDVRRRPVGDDRAELIEILNRALSAEYGTLFVLPRHMAQVTDEEIKRQLHLIADVELEHAEKNARLIYQLGGEPTGDLPNLQVRTGLREILEAHREGEREAIAIYEQAAAKCRDPKMRKVLEEMKRDEEGHQRLLQRTLDQL